MKDTINGAATSLPAAVSPAWPETATYADDAEPAATSCDPAPTDSTLSANATDARPPRHAHTSGGECATQSRTQAQAQTQPESAQLASAPSHSAQTHLEQTRATHTDGSEPNLATHSLMRTRADASIPGAATAGGTSVTSPTRGSPPEWVPSKATADLTPRSTPSLRRYHGATWDEPLIMQLGAPGRRALRFAPVEREIHNAIGSAINLIPSGARRRTPPQLPELSEPEVLRHYLHLSQQTLGMMGISLFGTCTMKYNSRMCEAVTSRPQSAETHPAQPDESLQGSLEILHRFDLILRELSGMDQFVFQAAGGADAAWAFVCLARAYFASRGELTQRNEIITSIQAHPCNPATAAAAGFSVITLPLEANGYPSTEALRAAVSSRTAALMINNPDDMGIYNPHIRDWIRIVHDAGALCFYDHANFNGVMGKIRARELGFDACMFMLHKTFGAPKGGGGPAVGAFGCTAGLAPFLPSPVVTFDGSAYRLGDAASAAADAASRGRAEHRDGDVAGAAGQGNSAMQSDELTRPQKATQTAILHTDASRAVSPGKVREYFGNIPQIIKAYAWARAMGAEGITEASDLSVLINNYMEKEILKIRGITRSHPDLPGWRMEMTRYSLGQLCEDTGVTAADIQQRMVDFGIDAYWMAHEPWQFPQPFTPEAGEMWSREDVDYWIAVLREICDEAYTTPEIVKLAPHHQPIHRVRTGGLDDPERWAMTWRAYLRKRRKTAGRQ
jgi:glycine dehydrogenase subunit 2